MSVPGTFLGPRPPRPRRDLSPQAKAACTALIGLGAIVAEAWQIGEVGVLAACEPSPGGYRWHVSVSAVGRYPTWDELKTAVYAIPTIRLPPGRTFAQLLGDEAVGPWVDLHPTTLHLFEIDNPTGEGR